MKLLNTVVLVASALLAADPATAKDNDDYDVQSYLSEHGFSTITGATATSLADALKSVYTSIHTRTEYLSAWSVLYTAVPTKVAESLQASGYTYFATTAAPDWYTGLPKDVKKELMKEQDAVESVVDKVLKITSSSTGGAMQQTAAPVMAGGVAAAGFLGAVAML